MKMRLRSIRFDRIKSQQEKRRSTAFFVYLFLCVPSTSTLFLFLLSLFVAASASVDDEGNGIRGRSDVAGRILINFETSSESESTGDEAAAARAC